MKESQAKKIFEKYNPADGVVRCPNGRAKMRKPLDIYAKAAVNLYGIIRRDEFVEIFNAQNEEQTTAEEVYTILLPNVLKFGWYGFYKDYIVHYAVLLDFDWVDYLEREQAGKPRYVPPKKQFLEFEWEEYEDNNYWQTVCKFMWDVFGYDKSTTEGFAEIKRYTTHSLGIKELGAIMEKHKLVFGSEKQVQNFLDTLMLAKNNTRMWENKGHTPKEMAKLLASRRPKESIIQPKKVGLNAPCPCGSGKKYKKCCARIKNSGAAQLSHSERKLFYETWYKLLDFVNQKHNIFNIRIKPIYPSYHDEPQLHKIREKLWVSPKVIGEFLSSTDSLSDEEIRLLQSWEKHHIKGQFVLVKYEPEYAVLMRMDEGKAPKLYAVKGMTTSIAEAMHCRLPVMLETVLLPFGDRIVYDSFMASHAIEFGGGIRDMFEDEYAKSKDKYGIITKL
ncbi:MAG: SEC-C metal-binding domain-containing protein [Sporomusa sp.]